MESKKDSTPKALELGLVYQAKELRKCMEHQHITLLCDEELYADEAEEQEFVITKTLEAFLYISEKSEQQPDIRQKAQVYIANKVV